MSMKSSLFSLQVFPVVRAVVYSHSLTCWGEEVPGAMLLAIVKYPMSDCNVVSFWRKCNPKGTSKPFFGLSLSRQPNLTPPLAYSSWKGKSVLPNRNCHSCVNLCRVVSGIGISFPANGRGYVKTGFNPKIVSDLFSYRYQQLSLWADNDKAENAVAHCSEKFCRKVKSLCKYFTSTSNSSPLVFFDTSKGLHLAATSSTKRLISDIWCQDSEKSISDFQLSQCNSATGK